jgi:hypothetical protein
MNHVRLFRRVAHLRGTGMTVAFALLYWALGLPLLFTSTSAAQLLQFSATASSSHPLAATSMIIGATTTNVWGQAGAASTTRITFDPAGGAFAFSGFATATDVFISRTGGGLNQVANSGACSGTASEVYVSNINPISEYIEFTTCSGDTVAGGQIYINLANAKITNPSVAPASYVIRWSGDMADGGDTRVAIISRVTVTASVDTNLTFTINGVASTTAVNGTTTSTTTSATAISFGVLSVAKSEFGAQRLNVSTNAINGFAVTVTQNQNLTSNNGADIDAFTNGNPQYPPAAWVNPTGTLGVENSYGHMGLTSEDLSIQGLDPYGTDLYAGLTSTSTRTVMWHDSVADGTTPHIGETYVGYRIMVTALQEAATDYTNQLTYVCTPIF